MSQSISNIVGHDGKPLQAALQVDIIADLVCPWCYLGKRRLDDGNALAHRDSYFSLMRGGLGEKHKLL